MPLQGVCWFLCCRQGFSLLGRDYGEKEEEESFELRNKEDLTLNGRVKTLHLHLHCCSCAWIFSIRNAWQTSDMQIPSKSYCGLKPAACAFKMTLYFEVASCDVHILSVNCVICGNHQFVQWLYHWCRTQNLLLRLPTLTFRFAWF